MLRLSILEQAPVSEESAPEEALRNTTRLAVEAEKWGYHRIWFAEHHGSEALASSSPEVMVAHVAAKTSRIHVGSGGVLLPHYSPFKVAENFHLLENLYPGRIDLGIGRAPGGMPGATRALNDGMRWDLKDYPRKVRDLIGYLTDHLPDGHPFQSVHATPLARRLPDIYLLGSSDGSARVAAETGTPFMFAHFINPNGGAEVVRAYRSAYQPSEAFPEPKASVCIFVVCAETDQEADRQASTLRYWMVKASQGRSVPIPETSKAVHYHPAAWERDQIKENEARIIVGNPQKVRIELEKLASMYQTDEVMLITNIFDFQAKLRSFELIARAFRT
ncbi:LLM class flavin-dependent oxidoreductase [Sporolactobacillus sp. Y61]|uniref:LLM class flavin-dependent oxidoreductase n=1 Tax=Sporolactobacillus sp. Y61 TaxID=3160863 RepID=A0AAU8ICI1_9BACL